MKKKALRPTGDQEPPWMTSANDRKMPYTEEQLEEFAEGFIKSMGDTEALQSLLAWKRPKRR